MKTARFDSVAKLYRLIERLTFGNLLQQARIAFIDAIEPPTNVLILGEGDGRFLAAFRSCWPNTNITVVDASQQMIDLARRRHGDSVTFRCGDARQIELGQSQFDTIVTHFFLDCFPQPDAERLIEKIAQTAKPNATWLLADFELPAQGWRRWHAKLWLATMYTFFRIMTGLEASTLPQVRSTLQSNGFAEAQRQTWRFGLLGSTQYTRKFHAKPNLDTMPS